MCENNELEQLCRKHGIKTTSSNEVKSFVGGFRIDNDTFNYNKITPINKIKLKPISQIKF